MGRARSPNVAELRLPEVVQNTTDGSLNAPRPNSHRPDDSSARGRYQTNAHVSGNVDADVIGEHAAVRNSESQSAAPYLAHVNLIAHTSDVWCDMPSELHVTTVALARFEQVFLCVGRLRSVKCVWVGQDYKGLR
jgi:hypothetical protein